MTYRASAGGCSSVYMIFAVGTSGAATEELAPGERSDPYPLRRLGVTEDAAYTVELTATTIVGGCSTGAISGWEGTLTFSRRERRR
jgi:hypothetical protein